MELVQERAIEKLENEKKLTDGGRVEKAIAGDTAKALIDFCKQSVDFAMAVYNGGSFEECCKAISKNVGSSISDFEIFSRAVKHYLPGADIKYRMEIIAGAVEKATESNVIKLDFNLENFF